MVAFNALWQIERCGDLRLQLCALQELFSAATDSRDDRNLRSARDPTHKPAGIANIFFPHEKVDVFSDFSLLGCDAISDPRVKYPQRRQCIGHGRGRGFYFNLAAPISEFAQGPRDVKRYRHDLPHSRTRFVGGRFVFGGSTRFVRHRRFCAR